MANSAISSITLPSGSTYDLHDKRVDSLNNWQYVVCTAAGDTPKDVTWDKSGTTITGTLVASSSTMYKIYLVPSANGTNDIYDEYITVNTTGSTYVWEMFGNTKLPDMNGYVKNASGHSGGTAGELAYKSSASGSGTVAVPKTYATSTTVATTEDKSVSVTGTTTGSVSLTKGTVDIKPSATGTAANVYKPAGSVSSSFTGTSSSGTISGTAAAQTISVKTAGATTTVNSITAVGTLPSCTLPTYTVSGETLTITGGSFSAGTLPTKGADTTVKTGDAAYQAASSTVSGSCAVTPNGSVSSSFSGTDTYLKTAVEVGTAASFSGASMTATGSVAVPKTFTSSTETATTENKTVSVTVS